MNSKAAQHLHHIAIDACQVLTQRRDVKGVALTGSVARGDAVVGSDIDIWVVGPRDGRETFEWQGASITYLWQTEASLQQHDTLLLYEIEDMWVYSDPHALFRRLRRSYSAQRGQIVEQMLHGTLQVMLALAAEAQQRPIAFGIAALRELARRVAASFIYLELGWRVPRFRHFAQFLPPRALPLFNRILDIPEGPLPWRRLLRLMQSHAEALRPLQQRASHYPPPLPTRQKIIGMGRAKRQIEAWLLLRSCLQSVGDDAVNGDDIESKLWALCQGFDQRAATSVQRRRLAQQVDRLIGLVRIEALMDPQRQLHSALGQIAKS